MAKKTRQKNRYIGDHRTKNRLEIPTIQHSTKVDLWGFCSLLETNSTDTPSVHTTRKELELVLQQLYELCMAHRTHDAVMLVYRFVNGMLMKGHTKECSEFLKEVDTNRLSPEVLVGLLRISYPARKKLSTWFDAYQRIFKELSQRHLDIAILLKGLV